MYGDGTNVCAELDGNGNERVRYTRGIRQIRNSKGIYYTHNAHGDVTALTDSAGNVTKNYEYDAFGVEKNKDDNDTNPFRYCGEYYDRETDTVYLRARYYNPRLGRFTAEDPAMDGLNWYVYASNNPIRYKDPTGFVITEEEQKMYEDGKMAPMAYTHMMNLTYHQYLADTDQERAVYEQWEKDFRDADYKTTNGVFKNVDEGIKFMSQKPEGELTEEEHYFRNELNLQFSWREFEKLQERLPDNLKWKKLPWEQSAFHKFGQINNRKYVSADGHFEIVYTKENYLVNEQFSSLNMGTYNFYGPDNAKMHKKYDVDPWMKWGNTKNGKLLAYIEW